VEETGSAECSNVVGHGKLTVKKNTKVYYTLFRQIAAAQNTVALTCMYLQSASRNRCTRKIDPTNNDHLTLNYRVVYIFLMYKQYLFDFFHPHPK